MKCHYHGRNTTDVLMMEMYGKIGHHATDPRNTTKRAPQDIVEQGDAAVQTYDLLTLQWPDQGREEEIFYYDLGKSEYYPARPRKHGHEKEVLAFEDRATGKPLIFRGFNLKNLRQGIRDRVHEELAPVKRGSNIPELVGEGAFVITDIEMPTIIPLAVVNQGQPGYLDFLDHPPAAVHTLH